MSAKTVFPSALVLTALSLCAARGQTPKYEQAAPLPGVTGQAPAMPPATSPDGTPVVPVSPVVPSGLSSYLTYNRPNGCCGPIGGNGPIGTELYFRTGPSFIFGGGVLDHTLQTGWTFDFGARSLFFNPEMTAAWAVNYGVSDSSYHGTNAGLKVPLTVLVPAPALLANGSAAPPATVRYGTDVPGVTIRNLNQTFLNLGFGRDVWILGAANCRDGTAWRVGLDFGGRYGSANLEMQELRHRTDVIGGVWAAFHTDLDIPCGCGWFVAGFRAEWNYVWSDILQQTTNADLQNVNLLLNFGYRF